MKENISDALKLPKKFIYMRKRICQLIPIKSS